MDISWRSLRLWSAKLLRMRLARVVKAFASSKAFELERRAIGGGCPIPPVVGVKSPHRQPNPLLCKSFQGDDREPSASAQPGRVGRNEDHNRRSRFGSGADLDSTDL
jgi:hypothetical protein